MSSASMTGHASRQQEEICGQNRASATLWARGPNTGGGSLTRPTSSAARCRDPPAHHNHDTMMVAITASSQMLATMLEIR